MNNDATQTDSLQLEKQLAIQETIIKCVHTLHISENIDKAINELLAIIADFYKADRGYIIEFDEDMILMSNTYEWCREGIEPEMERLQDLEIGVIDRWLADLGEKGEFYITALDKEVSEDSDEYKILAAQGIKSLMAAPLQIGDKLIGLIGVDNPRENTDTLLLMQSAAAFVVNDLTKRQTVEQRMINSICKVYVSLHLINLPRDTQQEFKSNKVIRFLEKKFDKASLQVEAVMKRLTTREYMEDMLEFSDLRTLNKRMAETDVLEHEFYARDGHWCRATFIVVNRDEQNDLNDVIYAVQLIDKEKKKELEYQKALKKALENQNEIYAEMMRIQGCGIIASQLDTGKVIMMNSAAVELFGLGKSENLYFELFDRMIVDDKEEIKINFLATMRNLGKYTYEFAVKRPDGGLVYVMSEVRTAILASGEKVMINSLMDITDKRKIENELRILSETDSLTRISNRRSGEIKTERLLAEGEKGMYCLLDIDKFKSINDIFGHATGDKALVEVAKCLKNSFRSTDVVMRLGGDEFAVFIVGVETKEQGVTYIKRLFENLEDIFIPEMGEYRISISLGAVLCADVDIKYDSIYAKADSAMYACKSKRGNAFDFYSEKAV